MDNPIELLKDIISRNERAHYEYLKEQECLATQREKLIANIVLMTSILSTKRECLDAYINGFFLERKYLRDLAESTLNKSIELGDSELAEVVINFIDSIYSKSPFEVLNNFTDVL